MLTTPASPPPRHCPSAPRRKVGGPVANCPVPQGEASPTVTPAVVRRSAWKACLLFFPAWWYVGVLVLAAAVVADLVALGLSALVPSFPWPYGDLTSVWVSLACQATERGFPC